MKSKSLLNNCLAFLLAGSAMLIGSGCTGGGGPGTPPDNRTVVSACSDHNNDKNACNNAKLSDGQACEYDDTTKTCGVKITISAKYCTDMSEDKDACEKDRRCTYDASKTPKCNDADASIAGKCEAIQAELPCKDIATCKWDNTVTPNKCVTLTATKSVEYLEFTFDNDRIAAGQGVTPDKDEYNIRAIGHNGDRTHVYFGVNGDNQRGKFFFFLANKSTQKQPHSSAEPDTADDNPGLAKLGGPINGLVKSIVAGPGQRAVIALDFVDDKLGAGKKYDGGILEIEGDKVVGAWYSLDAHLSVGVDKKNITNIAVIRDSWIAFVDSANAIASHSKFGATKDDVGLKSAKAEKGPTGANGDPLNKRIIASAVHGHDLFLAVHDLNDPIVVKNTIDTDAKLSDEVKLTPSLFTKAQVNNNETIRAIAVAGEKLLIGFGGINKGAIAIYDINSGNIIPPAHPGWGVKHIGVSADGKSAIIATNQGLLFYKNDKLVKLEQANLATDVANLTAAKVNENQPAVITNKLPANLDVSEVVGAVNGVGDQWFIATNKGIFRAVVVAKTKDI